MVCNGERSASVRCHRTMRGRSLEPGADDAPRTLPNVIQYRVWRSFAFINRYDITTLMQTQFVNLLPGNKQINYEYPRYIF